MQRRDFLNTSSKSTAVAWATASGLTFVQAAPVANWPMAAFQAKTLADVALALGIYQMPRESPALSLQAPDLAENGASVRVSARSTLAHTTHIALLVEKNPTALAALFEIPPGTEAHIATNLKIAESSRVYVLAQVGDQCWYAFKEIQVTLGGCGNV